MPLYFWPWIRLVVSIIPGRDVAIPFFLGVVGDSLSLMIWFHCRDSILVAGVTGLEFASPRNT